MGVQVVSGHELLALLDVNASSQAGGVPSKAIAWLHASRRRCQCGVPSYLKSCLQIASKALYEYSNQYPSLLGVPELRQAVARHSAAQQQIPCEWTTDTLITVGATEGIAAAFMGMVNPGDEVSCVSGMCKWWLG